MRHNYQNKFLILISILVIAFQIKVDPNTTLFVDQYHRVTVYHGVNVVFKTFPFYPDLTTFSSNYSLTDKDLFNLKNWGMNVIRLHAAWEGI
jgi:endoglycosylceramidase